MKNLIYIFLLSLMIAIGCATTDTVKESEGEGVSRIYQYEYIPVFEATLNAAKAKELDVVEHDEKAGRVILSHGVTLWSWGERIAIFVKPVNDASTEVEIVSKAVMSPLNFPPDWENILFDQIDTELKTKN
jgi:hypothetical protein